MLVELPEIEWNRWFPRLCLLSYCGFGIGNSIRQDFDQWLVETCLLVAFAVHFQEGLVAATQPITVNCSVYGGSCDYQVTYDVHAVPQTLYTKLHENLYSCPTVRLHYVFTADRYVKKVKLVMILSGSGSIFILGPYGIPEVLHLLTHTSGIGYGQSLRQTHR